MLGIRDMKISAKLTLLTTATSAIALVCVVVAFFIQDLRLVKRVKAEQVESQVAMLASNLAHAIAFKELDTVKTLAINSTQLHGITAVSIFDSANKLIFQFPQIAGELSPLRLDQSFEYRTEDLSRDIVWEGETIARLDVVVSYADVQKRIFYLTAYSSAALVFAVLLALGVSWLVQKIVSDPLVAMQKFTERVIRTGNYGLRSKNYGQDEIGQLASAINDMLRQIEQKDSKLEKQVTQRTRELKKLAEDFRYRALHDNLTGLPNRALLNEEFSRAVAHSKRVGKEFALLLLDLDNFKTINDSHGHEVGDELLKEFAEKIRGALRGEDMVCRLGGDEFVVLVEDIESEKHIAAVGSSILSSLEQIKRIKEVHVEVGVSIGASIFPRHGETIDELKRHADIAMYCAKEAGKNQLVVYKSAMSRANLSRMVLQNDLSSAVEKNQLELFYQPQIDERSKSVCGCEVLLRWRHQSLGLINPSDFIPIAEESGYIETLDEYVLMTACEQWRIISDRWEQALPLSINISANNFKSTKIVNTVSKALSHSNLPASKLCLEVSESALMNSQCGEEVVDALKKMGVKITLDDFGVGHSSLQALRHFNVDRVKLDASFSDSLNKEAKDRYLAKGIIALTKEIGVELIAEGIELQDQVNVLTSLGCYVIQGYVYTPPLSTAKFLQWLEDFRLASQSQVQAEGELSY